jgi:RNA polymerase sigma-70 factor (ECF subfamily)
MDRLISPVPDPERQASASEIRVLLEELIDSLPDANRAVFMLRDVEGMSTAEAAEVLSITEDNVKARLHRARISLREMLVLRAGIQCRDAFGFLGVRCDRIVQQVFARIAGLASDQVPGD